MNKQLNETPDLLSYATFLSDRNNFRKSGTRSGSEFNKFETPVNQYFKLLFYFKNQDSSNNPLDGGLLAPTWSIFESNVQDKYYKYNSAWSYLKMNGEEERAEKLKQFITLLSNISSQSPWFFSSISGLDGALERNAGQNKEFKIDEERKKISIKCLPDVYDTRIGTLLDLYRDIVWSWQTKREVVPSNLRKFDMGIFIFSDAIKNIHTPKKDEEATIFSESSRYLTSYKYIEFHNCEFDYNSSKSPMAELNNQEGFAPEYVIDIYFDDVYELRYNEFMMRTIGDMIKHDLDANLNSEVQQDSIKMMDELNKRIDMYKSDEGFLSNAVNELVGAGKSIVSNKIKSAVLGNLYTVSLPTLASQVKGAVKGQVFSTASAIDDYIEHVNGRKTKKVENLGNLFKSKAKNI